MEYGKVNSKKQLSIYITFFFKKSIYFEKVEKLKKAEKGRKRPKTEVPICKNCDNKCFVGKNFNVCAGGKEIAEIVFCVFCVLPVLTNPTTTNSAK